jgi:simple sugar transport system ATP-binding protein
MIQPRTMQRYAADLIRDFDIRATGPDQAAGTLSGGNQQKLVVAREVGRKAQLVVAAQPTRGVDIGATEFIHQQLVRLRSEGRAILLISADLDEVMGLADRIGVFYAGRLVGIREAATADRNELGLLMAGVES